MSIDTDPAAQISQRSSKSEGASLALLDLEDFGPATHAIIDFENWATFDDYLSAREGHALGLCFAGQDTRLVGVSLSAFQSWRRHGDLAPTTENLDAFAALVRDYRDNPEVGIEARAVGTSAAPSDWTSGRLADAWLTVYYSVELYAEWLNCLSAVSIFSLTPSPRVYARLLLEGWADFPIRNLGDAEN